MSVHNKAKALDWPRLMLLL